MLMLLYEIGCVSLMNMLMSVLVLNCRLMVMGVVLFSVVIVVNWQGMFLFLMFMDCIGLIVKCVGRVFVFVCGVMWMLVNRMLLVVGLMWMVLCMGVSLRGVDCLGNYVGCFFLQQLFFCGGGFCCFKFVCVVLQQFGVVFDSWQLDLEGVVVNIVCSQIYGKCLVQKKYDFFFLYLNFFYFIGYCGWCFGVVWCCYVFYCVFEYDGID